MTKHSSTRLAASAVCFVSLLKFAHSCQAGAAAAGASTASAGGRLQVEGVVYCDSCRVHNIATISGMIAGMKVGLQWQGRHKELWGCDGPVRNYNVEVDGVPNEVCEISLVSSGGPNCAELSPKSHLTGNLKDNQGMVSAKRVADPISFMTNQPLPNCAGVLKEEQQSS